MTDESSASVVDERIFNDRFLKLVLKVIQEKKDRFKIRTLVHIIWALSKLSFVNDATIEVLRDLKDYPRL